MPNLHTTPELQARKPRHDGAGRQPCRHCRWRSVPGLRKGQGLCPYHWAVSAYGQAWADKQYLPAIVVELTPDEIGLLTDALDSHEYWQLSEDQYRSSGYVMEPGSDDEENAEAIQDCNLLGARLAALLPPETKEGGGHD